MNAHSPSVRSVVVVGALLIAGWGLCASGGDVTEPATTEKSIGDPSSDGPVAGTVGPIVEEELFQAGIPPTIPAMSAALQDGAIDPRLRALSAVALGNTQDPSVIPLLLAALDDPEEQVREGAIGALHSFPDPRSVPRLRAILDDESTRGTDAGIRWRQSVLGAVAQIRTEEAAAVMLRTAFDPREATSVRSLALRLLRSSGAPTPIAELRALLLDRDAEIRIGAAWALTQTRDPSTVPVFVSAILEDAGRSDLRIHALVGLEVVTGETFRRLDWPAGPRTEDWPEITGRVEAWWQSNRPYYE